MKIYKILRPEYISKVIGAVFLATALYLFLYTDYTNAALASAFIGIFTVLIVNQPTVDESTAKAELSSGVTPINELLKDLELKSKGIAVPPMRNLTESRTYIPAGDFKELPELYDDMTVVSGGRGNMGVSLVPLGKTLLDEAKSKMEYDIEGEGIEASREIMGHLSQGMELAKSFSLRDEEYIKLRITHGKYLDYCEKLREDSPDICTRTGCPICSAYVTAAAEGISKPLRVFKLEKDGKYIKIGLEEV
ncbi:MAG: hypothetical protein ACLFVB_02435 [Thermoplasmata archaeon]